VARKPCIHARGNAEGLPRTKGLLVRLTGTTRERKTTVHRDLWWPELALRGGLRDDLKATLTEEGKFVAFHVSAVAYPADEAIGKAPRAEAARQS
jgi:hypothetical protein